jgi:hypothetical protein
LRSIRSATRYASPPRIGSPLVAYGSRTCYTSHSGYVCRPICRATRSGGSCLNMQRRGHNTAQRRRVPPPFLRHSGRSYCVVPILTPSASTACLVLRLACLLVSSSKLARGRRNRHVRRRQHGAQLANFAAHRTRLHRCQRGANEYARQFDRLFFQDKLERGLRRGGSRSKLVRSCFCGCWWGRVRYRACGIGHLVRCPRFSLGMKITHGLDCLLLCTVSSVWFFSVRPLVLLPIDWPYEFDPVFVAKQCTQLVARQREQHRYFNARQTRRKLPIRSLQH